MADKPAILQESRFTVEEGLAYRAARTGAIWMNKLFFSSLVLLVVWLLYGGLSGAAGCVETVNAPHDLSTATADAGKGTHCNVFLTATSTYLGAMALASFALSILFGVLGLVVGKRILEATPASQEAGAPEHAGLAPPTPPAPPAPPAGPPSQP